MIWGQQFGFGVRASPSSPNSSMPHLPSNDVGCPVGCLFEILADPTEAIDLREKQPQVFSQMLARQAGALI